MCLSTIYIITKYHLLRLCRWNICCLLQSFTEEATSHCCCSCSSSYYI